MSPKPKFARTSSALAVALGIVLAGTAATLGAEEPQKGTVSAGSPIGTSGALHTNRLSRKDLQIWNEIVKIVLAENRDGQPLHPTLRHLWDAVDTSGHVVYIEMPRNGRAGMAGRFAITKVDPEGRAHEGSLVMNLWTIENASTEPNDSLRANGFIPFKGLGPRERQAELLGHELAHAVWTFAEGERARLVMCLPSESLQVMRRLVDKAPGYDQLGGAANEIERLSRELEEPAEAAEEAIWEELRAGQRRQRASGKGEILSSRITTGSATLRFPPAPSERNE